jgi:nucleoside 2-deoxyribosyltransferase
VFLPNASEIGELKKRICRDYGLIGVFPADASIHPSGRGRTDDGLLIGHANHDLIRSCRVVVANITPFRGPSADVGTVYEMGFAHGEGLVVCAYSNVAERFTDRTVASPDLCVARGQEGRLRDRRGMAVEEWGMIDNLMIESCIHESRGHLAICDAPPGALFTWTGAFEECVAWLATRVAGVGPGGRRQDDGA